METLHGLEGLEYVENVRMTSNTKLATLAGLENLVEVGDSFQLGLCDGEPTPAGSVMTSLAGLENLQIVAHRFDICGADQLVDLQGLTSLETTGTWLRIGWNDSLASLDGAPELQSAAVVWIYGNPILPTCVATAFADSIETEEAPEIWGNLPDACGE